MWVGVDGIMTIMVVSDSDGHVDKLKRMLP